MTKNKNVIPETYRKTHELGDRLYIGSEVKKVESIETMINSKIKPNARLDCPYKEEKTIQLAITTRDDFHTHGLGFILILMTTVAGLRSLLGKSTAEEHVEQLLSREFRLESSGIGILVLPVAIVTKVVAATNELLLILPIQIVRLALLWIGKNGHCISNRLEGFRRTWRLVFVRMHLKSELLVSFLNLSVG